MSSRPDAVVATWPFVRGEATGVPLSLDHGLSFAMGFDVERGRITDVHSAHAGTELAGRVLLMPSGRGSSSASTALAEAIRLDTAPAAIILTEPDEILAVGAIVARTLYRRTCPILVATHDEHQRMAAAARLDISADGSVRMQRVSRS